MSQQPFNRLAPFIQDYIYTHGWTELRQVQIEACRIIFDTNAHLLLAAGTASGKTEAAFLPVLTLLHQNPSKTVGVLYIGPIKALINDQFERLNDLLQEADIPVWAWHGDVSSSRKQRLLKHPQGVLQITPESLESLLINKTSELTRLFGDLRFVIIDEIHAFTGSERGSQILCQLARLSRCIQKSPRRIGLSATLGDYSLAEEWLRSGTELPVITPQIQGGQRKVQLAIEHFYSSDANELTSYTHYLFNHTKGRKCLIFANNRTEAESAIASLRTIAKTQKLPDIYHVHHGSISASLRETAEAAMRGNSPAVTAATVTLELGIDIGQLERVIQLNAPFSVSSFLQRLGRTGRRGRPADMRFICTEEEPSGEESLPEQIPWQMLQCIAIIQLYLEERWIEPIKPPRYPLSLLYHQTMSILASVGELSPPALAQQVLTLPIFTAISSEDFRQLLHYLIDIDHIEQTEKGGLIVGITAEKIVRNFRFYAVFSDSLEYSVRDDSREIGSIVMPPPPGNRFALAGKTWEIRDVDTKSKTLWVKPVDGIASTSWRSGSGSIHTKVLQRMRRVLFEDVDYLYLQNGAKERLRAARQLTKFFRLDKETILLIDGKNYCIFPWAGTVAYRTLERFLNVRVRESLDIRRIGGKSPYFLTIKLGKNTVEELEAEILSFCKKDLTGEDLVTSDEAQKLQKYDKFIPNNLLRKAFAGDYLDVEDLRQTMRTW
ncbi:MULTISPECIES: DEAD/DEAH box helicase [unclassified Coleofasciculus]|uniref:DEAD/DEAH box helicase n=1 Tax=unclassified Coleofasciculus TaxID=2692782 RepID=UPI001882BAE1|nr:MULTISPECIES: DEAD/DEAH box helicase [unclassified Coleofasciculus]MBE9128738.1 DEAD/DEAH box helicase [Coleofasciculus sp. LEGE 07081]MBE9151812.1 DEAD/DEAH box helicase [Coleofasciculus sp. LEGE 07092]